MNLAPARSDSLSDASLCDALFDRLYALGARDAFGIVGGAIAPLCAALERSPLRALQTRHEAGALFAATEASLATGRPVLAFVTTGPGLTNALTGALAARWEGARVILLSGSTSPAQRGRGAVQESGPGTLPAAAVYRPGPIFHEAALVDTPAELAAALDRIAAGLAAPGGFVAHLALPVSLQRAPAAALGPGGRPAHRAPVEPTPAALAQAVSALSGGPFWIWAGHGARHAGPELAAFAARVGAPVLLTPRAKGVIPERSPLCLGVSGCGGHDHVGPALAALGMRRALVLGSRLGEFSSCWDSALVPRDGFVHVDLDPGAFGAAYPDARTVGVVADVGAFLRAAGPWLSARPAPAWDRPAPAPLPAEGPRVAPQAVLAALQAEVLDATEVPLIAESGNAFLWANQLLQAPAPGRYRVSGSWGSMGHATSGVLGLAVAHGRAVALVGDGAMLMMHELSTAVQHGLPVVWVILNDAQMGIVDKGMRGLGLRPFQTALPATDFAALARAHGAEGRRVERAAELGPALREALAAPGPTVIDVWIDPDEPSPFARRVSTLHAMSAGGPR